MENKNGIVRCREHFKCGVTACPAFNSGDHRCWLICGTYCHDRIQGTWLEKMEACLKCEVFNRNFSKSDCRETFLLLSEQFAEYRERIDKEKDNLELKIEARTKEISQMQAKLIQSAKMMSVGRFSAGIAHEINNPLGAVINYVRTILGNPEIKSRTRDYLELSLKGLFRIQNIVRQILSYSSVRDQETMEVNINDAVRETVAFIKHQAEEKRISISLRLKKDLLAIQANPLHLTQVFSNIIKNAIDSMNDGGTLDISTDYDGSGIRIDFRDTGQGIKEEDMDKILDPFYTTKEVGEGTGLGLFVSYNILLIYQGKLSIKNNEKNGGVTVTVFFPAAERGEKI